MDLVAGVAPTQWALIGLSGLLIGMNKAGLMGAAMASIPIMAGIFGAQASVGVVLPMLVTADVVAVIYYRRHADWGIVLRLLPWTLVGVGLGVIVGDTIPEESFRFLLAIVVLVGVALLAYKEIMHRDVQVPERWWIAAILGVLAGFATMVGNAAGPITTLYLFSMGLSKNQFIGTGAWFFFIVNVLKIPLHVIFWKTITVDTLMVDLIAVPIIVIGGLVGLVLVKYIKERPYRVFVLVITTIISIRLFF
ncbi:MAG: sulfite exporter TauE/SafE family protein [Spirochaetota bacterium]